LAYILVSSIFLNVIFSLFWNGSSEFFWAIIVVMLGACITALPLRREALINGILTLLLIIFVVFLSALLLPNVTFTNLGGFDMSRVFIPYGVLLFALSGGVVVPDVIAFLGRGNKKIRRAIIVGTIIPAVLYFFFAFTVAGSLGERVSAEAIESIGALLGERIVLLGSAVGFLAAFTSYIVLSVSFRELFRLDFRMRKISAWIFAMSIPAILYLFGFQNFIAVIGAVGALAVGIDSALILAAHHSMRRGEGMKFRRFSYLWKLAVYAIIAAGVLYEIFKLL
ncbi:MAG: hypothetical protein HYZ69_01915, partial [Candidatus Colwellbacteria bacterium]|nr:hypothetical protein [Candidatus Colwellbacteria bacterium]